MSEPSSENPEALEDACYYLARLGMSDDAIARQLGLQVAQVTLLRRAFEERLRRGEAVQSDFDLSFWRGVNREAGGDVRVTLVDGQDHFYHGWKSDLERAETKELMTLFEYSKRFLERHPEVAVVRPPTGYDPLGPIRDVRASLPILEKVLMQRARRDLDQTRATSNVREADTR